MRQPPFFLLFALAFGPLHLTAQEKNESPLFETVTVFPASPGNKPNYRIPALIQAPNGDLLLFAEKRIDGIGDIGNHDIVLSRSSDKGKHWNPEQLVFDDGSGCATDITICVDKEKGRIFLFFLKDKKQYAYLASDDSGAAWTGPVIIHKSVTKPEWDKVGTLSKGVAESHTDEESATNSKAKTWKKGWFQRYGVGPGAGALQLTQGPKAGRLIVPARHREEPAPGKFETWTHVFYSDDHGATWKLGPNVARNGSETQMAELPNGEILMNMRNENPRLLPDFARRLVAISKDGGETWSETFQDNGLLCTRCEASTRLYNAPGSAHNGLLLFCNPAMPFRQKEHPYGRYNMTLRWSRDNGRTWSAGRTIYPHTSSYCDIAVLDDATIGLAYERGPKNSVNYWDEIQFARFNMNWLLASPWTPAAQK